MIEFKFNLLKTCIIVIYVSYAIFIKIIKLIKKLIRNQIKYVIRLLII